MANLQRIRTGSTGALTALERESLHALVKEYNSDFRVKTATVDDVSKITPEEGAIVVSEHDGKQYYADMFGWHQAGAEYSPITLFIDFDGTTQFAFKFKLPSTNTITLNWGDGTNTEVAGQDDTEVVEASAYASAGLYNFTVTGDVTEITMVKISGQTMVIGDITGWNRLTKMTDLQTAIVPVTGNINGWGNMNQITNAAGIASNLSGNINVCDGWIGLTNLSFARNAGIYGDLSTLENIVTAAITLAETSVEFNRLISWPLEGSLNCDSCNWTINMVDNCLMSIAAGGVIADKIINIGGNNAKRTSKSDAAYDALIAAGNTVTVNE